MRKGHPSFFSYLAAQLGIFVRYPSFFSLTHSHARHYFRVSIIVPYIVPQCLVMVPEADPLAPLGQHRGHRPSPHRKWVRNALTSSRPTERDLVRPLQMLPSFKTSPQPSLLQRLSSPKPKSTTLLDRISRSSYSMTNQSKQQRKVMVKPTARKQLTSHLSPPNELCLQTQRSEPERDRSPVRLLPLVDPREPIRWTRIVR